MVAQADGFCGVLLHEDSALVGLTTKAADIAFAFYVHCATGNGIPFPLLPAIVADAVAPAAH